MLSNLNHQDLMSPFSPITQKVSVSCNELQFLDDAFDENTKRNKK